MPRSGSTAAYNLMREYLSRCGELDLLGFFNDERLKAEEAVLIRHVKSPSIKILKTHSRLPNALDQLVCDGQAFCTYSVRDIRKIANSMKRVWNMSDAQVLEGLDQHSKIASDMSARDNVHVLRYESMAEDFEALLTFVSQHLHIPYDAQAAAAATQAVSALNAAPKSKALVRAAVFWGRFVLRLNRHLRIGKLLKLILPHESVSNLRDRATFVDRKTMLHPGHIGVATTSNSDKKLDAHVELIYASWLATFGYIDK